MHRLPSHKRMLLLTEGHLGPFTAKTAASLLRYRPDDVVGLVDSQAAGRDVREVIPWAPPVPILSEVGQAEALRPDALYVGVAPPGGSLPAAMRRQVLQALERGLDVVSGLHERLRSDEAFVQAAEAHGARLYDLREPPTGLPLATGRARDTRCRRVLTVGTDGNVGKMAVALELVSAARRRGLEARFVATGQTGIMVAGSGVAIDAVPADFAPGAVEAMVLAAGEADVCVVEGQGSLAHPGFSAVTLALLHGACPDAMILVHHVGRTHYKAPPHGPIPPLRELRAAYEQVASLLHPSRVVGVALNPLGNPPAVVRAEAEALRQELRLPVLDPLAEGGERLLEAALA